MTEDKKPLELADVLNEMKAKAWNESIAPRGAQLRSLLKTDEWLNGIAAWLSFQERELDRKLRFGCKTRDDDQFVRGQLAMLVEILDIPRKLEVIQARNDQQKKHAASRGQAGY
jgi:hypothetical protein